MIEGFDAEPVYFFFQLFGEVHPTVAETLNNIGLVMYAQGQVKESIPVFERALVIKKQAYGSQNPGVASALFTVGGLYHKAGEFEKAREKYLEARDIRFGLFGGRHKETKQCDEMMTVLEKDQLKAAAKESKLKSNLRSQVPSARAGGLANDSPGKGKSGFGDSEMGKSGEPPLLMEGSIFDNEGEGPLFDSNRS